MHTGHDFLKAAWECRGKDELILSEIRKVPDLPSLERTEWNTEFGCLLHDYLRKESIPSDRGTFYRLMHNRLIMGAFRYGLFGDPKKMALKYDRLGSVSKRLEVYQKTHNREYLVDIANMCMLEFCEGPFRDIPYVEYPVDTVLCKLARAELLVHTFMYSVYWYRAVGRRQYLVQMAALCYAEFHMGPYKDVPLHSVDDGIHAEKGN